MLVASLLSVLLASTCSAITYEVQNSYGYMLPGQLHDGPSLKIPDGLCTGFLDVSISPFDKLFCNGSLPLRLEAYGYHDTPYPSVDMKTLGTFVASKSEDSNCKGVMRVKTKFMCTTPLYDYNPSE